ncbi:MAG TPA: polymorphic toxin type 15 domain-containing protein, partial [Chitinophaga sp.]
KSRQIEEAQILLNTKANLRTEFRNNKGKNPTPAEAAKLDKEAVKLVKNYMANTAALHGPDQVGGGHFAGLHGLGLLRVNSSIGSQWAKRYVDQDDDTESDVKARGNKLLAHVKSFVDKNSLKKDDLMKIKMNVSLLLKKRT